MHTNALFNHHITYNNNKLYQSKNIIYSSSDSQNLIFYTTDTNVVEYNTTTGLSRNIFTGKVKGLAYKNNLLILDNNGTLYKGPNTIYATGVNDIYDTVDGFYISIGNINSYTTDNTKANGNYGLIQFTIV